MKSTRRVPSTSIPGRRGPARARRRRPLRVLLLLGASLASASCADLALVPDQVPDELIIEPLDTLITQGDQIQLRVTVLDEDGEPFASFPYWAPPEWTVDPEEALAIEPDGSTEALGGGKIRVEARLAGLVGRNTVRINPNQVALTAPLIYLAQVVQNLDGDVPLIAGRNAMLRVFVTSDPGSFYEPAGRASFYLNGNLTHQALMLPRGDLLPDFIDERRLERSLNAIVPGDVLQPGVELVVELDTEGVVPLAPGSQLRIPAEGRTALDVREMPTLDLTIVPTLLADDPDEAIFAWVDGLSETTGPLGMAKTLLPVGDLNLIVHEPYTTTADLTTDGGWSQYLSEINLMRVAEGAVGYYYGSVVLPQFSVWGGLGYIGLPASVGGRSESTLAHELGHNMSLRHAPCGGVASSDPAYPYAGGSIGVWGYANLGGSGTGTLKTPELMKDLMGYCSPRWISDYHFTKAMAFRTAYDLLHAPAGAPEPVVLLWGGIDGGRLYIEPAFALDAPANLPTEPGDHRLEGTTADGRSLFSLSFDLTEVSRGGGHFSFAVPLAEDDLQALESIVVTGPEGRAALDRSDRSRRAALIRDETTGQVRGILRDGGIPATAPAGSVLTTTDGIPTRRRDGRRP